MIRRSFLQLGSAAAGVALVTHATKTQAAPHAHAPGSTPATAPAIAPDTPAARSPVVAPGGQVAVVTPNGSTLPWRVVGGVKVGHLIAEPVDHEFAPGLRAECWGYNGRVHGPTIEAVEGDRVRVYVTNKLKAPTTVHWHGIFLPNGMDGVGGLNQKVKVTVGCVVPMQRRAKHSHAAYAVAQCDLADLRAVEG